MAIDDSGDVLTSTHEPTDECGWRDWFATGPGIKVLLDPADGRIVEASNAAAAFYGYPRETLRTMSAPDVCVLPGDVLRGYLAEAAAAPDGAHVRRIPQRLASGEVRIVDAYAGIVQRGPRSYLEVVLHDVTEETHSLRDLERLAAAVEQSTESVVITDADATIVYVNPAFERLTGYRRSEVVGQNPRILKSGVQSATFYDAMWAALSNGIPWVADLTNRRKDGSLFQEEAVITPLRDGEGAITGYVAVKRDVTRERALEAAGVAVQRERAFILETLRHVPTGMSPEATAQAVCEQVVSMTGLTHAHLFLFDPEGSAVPIGLATHDGSTATGRALPRERSAYLRQRAAVGPWIEAWAGSSDHPYGALLRRLGVSAAAYVPIRADDILVGLLIVGATATDAPTILSTSLPGLLEAAEVAGVLLAPALLEQDARLRARQRITSIVERHAFESVFQPIISLADDRVVGYEALTRFADGAAPDLVFAEARRAGLDPLLEIATLEASLVAAATLPAGSFLSVNLSPGRILQEGLGQVLTGLDRPLVVEITEHESVADYGRLRRALERVAPGARLAVDDAGAGVANFDHLVGLRPQFIKVDGALIRGVDADPARQALVVALLHFATATGAQVIAEGIETAGERRMLRRLGVVLGQGYLLGRPAPASAWLPAGDPGGPGVRPDARAVGAQAVAEGAPPVGIAARPRRRADRVAASLTE